MIQQQREDEILFDGQFRHQIETLKNKADVAAAEYGKVPFFHRENVLPVQEHPARGRGVQGADDVEQRAFAGA